MSSFNTRVVCFYCFTLIGLLGCSAIPDHSNTLIFATETKFAIDIGTSTTAQSPELTVGYKRTEAVWLPLIANQKNQNGDWVPSSCGAEDSNADCTFKSSSTTDAYSVLASFGAEFGGEGQVEANKPIEGESETSIAKGTTKASGGIAQYFATGLAAQQLAQKGGASLVTIQSGNTSKVEQSPTEILMELYGVTKEQAEEIETKNKNTIENNKTRIDAILLKLAPDGVFDPVKTTQAVNAVNAIAALYLNYGSLQKLLSATDISQAKKHLNDLSLVDEPLGQKHPLEALLSEAYK